MRVKVIGTAVMVGGGRGDQYGENWVKIIEFSDGYKGCWSKS